MELTKEQRDIINSTGNIKINAVAGSGKTTTVIEYAKARSRESRILYLAFNRTVKMEASLKFKKARLNNVDVQTAHSLAYKWIIPGSPYKLRQSYKIYEIAELLGLRGTGEKHAKYIIANHISKFITYFCNSDKSRIQDLDYLDIVSDAKARVFVKNYYRYIEGHTRLLLGKMDKAEIEIIHDFYLKKFQLSHPKLNYDYILFDEGQDASPAMLDIFFRQNATKVIVGDASQQIYGWRHAVNSLEMADFKSYNLSTSFRFNQNIANLAMEVLQWKKHLESYEALQIKGVGASDKYKEKAVLARTNLGLLLKAIEYVMEKGEVKHLYFEGNINSYTYASEGASLYDVLNLYTGRFNLIKDKLIKQMTSLEELADYIEKTEDKELSMMVDIVKTYRNEIPAIIKAIKKMHVGDAEKEKAEIIFSTVHRCKGMEYDAVQLADDFITEEKVERQKNEVKDEEIALAKVKEEINLLYVAVTRTRNKLYIYESLVPKNFPRVPGIHVLKLKAEQQENEQREPVKEVKPGIQPPDVANKTYTFSQIREEYPEAYKPWTAELDEELHEMFLGGVNIKNIATNFQRTKGAIESRIKKLELK